MAFMTTSMMAIFLTLGQQAALRPTKVAVVDIPAVSEQYQRTRDLEAGFEKERVSLNQRRDDLRAKIERTGRSLQEQFKPGTAEFNERRKQLAMLEAELQWMVETESQRIEIQLADSLRGIYADIQVAVGEVAEEYKIDVVLAADRLPPESPGTTSQARQQIILQKVVYWSPGVDLTGAVIARANAIYAASKSASGPGRAAPPHSDEAGLRSDR